MENKTVVFKGPPNHLVVIVPGLLMYNLPKNIRFDNQGFYECSNPYLAIRLRKKFEEAIRYKCKHCEFETNNKGSLASHYRTHKKKEKENE